MPKRMIPVFCMWTIYFSTNSDDCFSLWFLMKFSVYFIQKSPLLLWFLRNIVWETYCVCSVSYYYGSQTKFVRHIVFALFLIIIIIMAPKRSLWDILLLLCFLLLLHHPDFCRVMYCYSTFSLLLLLLFFHTFLSARFLGDAWIKLYETL